MALSLRDILALPEVEQFKTDRRSRVWRVREGEGGSAADYAVKQYRHNTLRQRAAWLIGVHPCQRERQVAAALANDGIAVVPVITIGMRDGQGYLVTRYAGPSLQVAVQQGMLDDHIRRTTVLKRVIVVAAKLVERGWYFRDLQLANMVLADNDNVMLIDTGSARRSRSQDHEFRMLGLLARTALMEGVPWPTCLRASLYAADALDDHTQRKRYAKGLALTIGQLPDLWPLPEGWVPPRFAKETGDG